MDGPEPPGIDCGRIHGPYMIRIPGRDGTRLFLLPGFQGYRGLRRFPARLWSVQDIPHCRRRNEDVQEGQLVCDSGSTPIDVGLCYLPDQSSDFQRSFIGWSGGGLRLVLDLMEPAVEG